MCPITSKNPCGGVPRRSTAPLSQEITRILEEAVHGRGLPAGSIDRRAKESVPRRRATDPAPRRRAVDVSYVASGDGSDEGRREEKDKFVSVIKLLLVLALIALLVWLLYRRLRPYIQLLRQLLGVFKGTIDPGANSSPGEFRQDPQIANSKLVRCAECNTWIPLSRALNANSTSYCSRECLKKAPALRSRKTAS